MLKMIVKKQTLYDEQKELFIDVKPTILRMEHSLVSISDWEKKYKTPFLTFIESKDKNSEQILYYFYCMTLDNEDIDFNVYKCLTKEQINDILKYIEDKQTATWFSKNKGGKSREIITSEIIYYWMITLDIPVEFEKWNFNRLMTLIQVCNIKNSNEKGMSRKDIYKYNDALNDARKAKYMG